MELYICQIILRALFKNTIFLLLLLACLPAGAQFIGCVDSLSINPSFPCPNNDFYPVCGCDNKTYRNECDAKQKHGVQTYTDGSCSGYEIDIIPTFDPYNLYFTLVQANPNFSRLFIVDTYGKLWWNKEMPAMPREYFQIDISALPVGTYILYVYDSKGTYRYKRFTRMPF
jgi:hypothetical protein